jgi:hypothetical protein
LDAGIFVTDEIIMASFSKEQRIKLLMNSGIDVDRIAKLFTKYLLGRSGGTNIAKTLINSGIDFNQYIMNCQ